LIHPEEIAQSFNIPYTVAHHNSQETKNLLSDIKPETGMIAGARILKKEIIDTFSKGIINFHPGLIPESRGLDAMLWSIHNSIPLGVTSHIIDEQIDAGKILEIVKIKIYKDDTLFDLSERLYEKQLEMIKTSFSKLEMEVFETVDFSESNYNKKMPSNLELTIEGKLENYLLKYRQ
jgi:phosphoribosylglycinamide formyltransferase-1